jgi:hypothetical protein
MAERLQALHEELEVLNAEAHELEERIAENVALLLESSPLPGGTQPWCAQPAAD